MPRSRRRTREVIGKTPERETTSAAISVLVVSLTRRRSVCTKSEPDLLFSLFGNSFPVRSDSSIRSCSSSLFVRALPRLYCLTSFFRVRLIPWLVRRTVAHDRSHTTRHAPTWLRSAMRLARTPFPLSRSRDASTPPPTIAAVAAPPQSLPSFAVLQRHQSAASLPPRNADGSFRPVHFVE